jgi:hypothetical protein
VNDVLHDTLNEPIALAVVEHTELGGTLAGTGVRFEDGPTALTLTCTQPCSASRVPRGQHSEAAGMALIVAANSHVPSCND